MLMLLMVKYLSNPNLQLPWTCHLAIYIHVHYFKFGFNVHTCLNLWSKFSGFIIPLFIVSFSIFSFLFFLCLWFPSFSAALPFSLLMLLIAKVKIEFICYDLR